MAKLLPASAENWNPPSRRKERQRDQVDDFMDTLEEQGYIDIEADDEKELRSLRLTLGRRGKARGYAVEQYSEGLVIHVRKGDAPSPDTPLPVAEPSEPAEPAKQRPSRPRRTRAADSEPVTPE